MACDCCTNARETATRWRFFDPACLYCGARLIARIGQAKAMPSEIAQRRRVVLADWLKQGHSEAELRELAKGLPALEPIAKEATNEPRKKRKH